MPEKFDSWASYFYPETYDAQLGLGTMRNVPGIKDLSALRSYDYRMSFARRTELELRPELVARTFDGEHIKAIHKQLFQDVYAWAGEYRTVNISKGGAAAFADAHSGAIDAYLNAARAMVETTDWPNLDHAVFAERTAEIFSYVNHAHGMREGNGRTSKVFMDHVAEKSPFTLQFERVPEEVWNLASAATRPPLGEEIPNHRPMVPVFEHSAVPRSAVMIHEGGRVTIDPAPDKTMRNEKPMTLGERIEAKLGELREERTTKAKHAAERPTKNPELDGGPEQLSPPERDGKRDLGGGR